MLQIQECLLFSMEHKLDLVRPSAWNQPEIIMLYILWYFNVSLVTWINVLKLKPGSPFSNATSIADDSSHPRYFHELFTSKYHWGLSERMFKEKLSASISFSIDKCADGPVRIKLKLNDMQHRNVVTNKALNSITQNDLKSGFWSYDSKHFRYIFPSYGSLILTHSKQDVFYFTKVTGLVFHYLVWLVNLYAELCVGTENSINSENIRLF